MANRYIQSAESCGSVVRMNLIPRRIAERQAPASELNPQPPTYEADMEIKDALPFDESIASDVVIADPESLDAD